MTLSLSLRFHSDRFDLTSGLPEEYNAGHRFYGKDVVEFLARELVSPGYPADYLDEDHSSLGFDAAAPGGAGGSGQVSRGPPGRGRRARWRGPAAGR